MKAGIVIIVAAAATLGLTAAFDQALLSMLGLEAHAALLEGILVAAVAAAWLVPIILRLQRVLEALEARLQAFARGESGSPVTFSGIRALGASLERSLGEATRREREQLEQRQAAELARKVAEGERDRLVDVLQSLRDGVVVTDAFDEVVFANPAAGRALGFDPDEAAHRPLSELTDEESLVRLVVESRERGAAGTPRRLDLERPGSGRDSEVRSWETEVQPFAGPDGRNLGTVTVLHDATRDREVANMKSDFVAKASHELRTPLSSIRAYVEMLVDGEANDEESRAEFYGVIQAETERLGRLIDNMLNISRIEAGIVQVERAPVDLREVITRVVGTMEPQAAEKRIAIVGKPSDVDLVVEADQDMLEQVVVNLASNAIKYTPEGGRVTITADSDNLTGSVVVSVQDTGLGIPPDALEQVFDKFYRIDSYKRVAKGTGLGLSLCRHIVESVHGGEIGVESTVGMGSRFWFSVPVRNRGSKAAA